LEIHPDFSDLLRAFNAENVRYLIVGAHAVATHSRAHATKDLDVWVDPEQENASRVYRALANFGAPLQSVTSADFSNPDVVFQIGVEPIRIDILTSIDGVEFEEAWSGRVETTLGPVRVYVIGRDALIRNKRSVGRARDLADIEELLREPTD
jgi:hypothetical protein